MKNILGIDEEKKCSRCGQIKAVSLFNKENARKDGLSSVCKECNSIKNFEWSQKNPEKVNARSRKWRKENPEKARANTKRWRRNNSEKVKAISLRRYERVTNSNRSITTGQWKKLCEFYQNQCLCCKKNTVFLTQDHILPVSLGGSNHIENIQPLCLYCNQSKGQKYIDYRPRNEQGEIIFLPTIFFESTTSLKAQMAMT